MRLNHIEKIAFVLGACFLLAMSYSIRAETQGDRIIGMWWTEENKSQVEVYQQDGRYRAKIVQLKKPNYTEADRVSADLLGKPKRDRNNPDEALKGRLIEGMSFMQDFEFDGGDEWTGGKIYDPESGKIYRCKMTLTDQGKSLKVRGYIGVSLFGRTTVWTRDPS